MIYNQFFEFFESDFRKPNRQDIDLFNKNQDFKRNLFSRKISKNEKKLFKVLLITQENRKKSDCFWKSNKNSKRRRNTNFR